MRTNYVLVDFENVQPKDFGLLKDGHFKVMLFLGPNQKKVPVDVAAAMQPLGDRVEYVLLDGAGNNALDFHIAYHIGRLSTADPAGYFHVVSKDTGFDPLVRHLKTRHVLSQRSTTIADMPCFKMALPPALDAQLEAVVADLTRRKAARPRTEKTLRSTLHALFKELTAPQLDAILKALIDRGIVGLEGTKVSYALPSEP